MKIVICGTTFELRFEELMMEVINTFKKNDIDIFLERSFSKFVYKNTAIKPEDIKSTDISTSGDIDFVISFGGDGTFLSTAHKVAERNIPILGINAGNLGFLADIDFPAKNIKYLIKEVISGRYKIEQRSMLSVKIAGDVAEYIALNDVAVMRQEKCSLITVDVRINGDFLNSYRADGLLIATPTGSTAYSLSAGGPIVCPQAENLLVVPVSPHSLTVRPMIIRDDSVVEIGVRSRNKKYQIAIDGHSFSLPDTTTIIIEKSKYKIQSIHPLKHNFFKTIRNKLMWGSDYFE